MRRSTTATRPYRLYFRGAMTLPEQRRDAILASDEEACQLAMRMLGDRFPVSTRV